MVQMAQRTCKISCGLGTNVTLEK